MNEDWIYVIGNGTQGPYAPKTTADMVYMDDSQSQTLKEEILQQAPGHFLAEFPVSGWSTKKPYTQTVAVNGLLETDVLFADVVLSDTAATAINEIEAYGCVSRLEAGNGHLTVYCYVKKPTVNITLQAKVVRL